MATEFSFLINANHDHRELMDLARQIDAGDFGTIWYADERFYRETYTGLAAMALSTERVKLATGVTDPFTRHPALTAMAAGSLDELSNGRAILGLGAGRSGFDEMGMYPDRAARRTREAIEIIRRLLAGEKLTYEGEIFKVQNLNLKFPTRADIPIVLAAEGPLMLRLAGEVADGVMVGHCAGPEVLKDRLQYVWEGAERARRQTPPKVIARLDTSISRDREEAIYQAKRRHGRYLWLRYPNIWYMEMMGIEMPAELDRRFREAGPPSRSHNLADFDRFADAITDEMVLPIDLAGAPADVAGQMRALQAAGADEIMAYPLTPPGITWPMAIDLFGEAVALTKAG